MKFKWSPKLRKRSAARAAMTLLEVILSIAILGGSLAVLGELVRVGTRSAQSARTLATAQLLADSLTAEICAGVATPESTEGMVEDFGGRQWAYTVQVEQVEQQGLLGILVTVRENVDPLQRPTTFSLVRWMIDPQTEVDLELAAAEAAAASGTSSSSGSGSSSSDSSSGSSGSGSVGGER